MRISVRRPGIAWPALATPLIAIKIGILLGIGYYSIRELGGDVAAVLAFCALLVLVVRWRIIGFATWATCWMLYALALVITLAEALSFFFQGTTFNTRFFANITLDSLQPGLKAFPVLLWGTALILGLALLLSGWLLAGQRTSPASGDISRRAKSLTLVALALVACAVPSSAQRFAHFIAWYGRTDELAFTKAGRAIAAHLLPDPPPPTDVRAKVGKNLVIIYMESLERIYTDEKIFPGLTPNLNRYRAHSLDFAGYQTFTGANYTIAGIFASQCGVPYFTSPWHAFDIAGNNASAASFQPNLACLGDVLHAAGYKQVYMNPAALSFADQGEFFRLHRFDEVLGLNELERANDNRLQNVGWGLYDSDLFQLAARKFDELADSGKPFHLDVLTIDDHPPHGRPSPGCPAYQANRNDILQAVHCTDALVGKFLNAISRNPAWKNTVVAVMSDHQSMLNDAWPLYPENYRRRPLLFILNAGQGTRQQRFYHMDIAPTLLHLMGIKTNAQFIAGTDRSEPDAPSSPLLNDDTNVAVLRHAVWSHAAPVKLCKHHLLIKRRGRQFEIGGRDLNIATFGQPVYSLTSDQTLAFFIDHSNVSSIIAGEQQWKSLSSNPRNTSILTIHALPDGRSGPDLFSIDLIGVHGAVAHLADVQRLKDLKVASADCAGLLKQADDASGGTKLDFSRQFQASAATAYPTLPGFPAHLALAEASGRPYKLELGWYGGERQGAVVAGDDAAVGFHVSDPYCRSPITTAWAIKPILYPWRPAMDVRVTVNGKETALWHFAGRDAETWHVMDAPLPLKNGTCDALIRLHFSRPGSTRPPRPDAENPRHFQIFVRELSISD